MAFEIIKKMDVVKELVEVIEESEANLDVKIGKIQKLFHDFLTAVPTNLNNTSTIRLIVCLSVFVCDMMSIMCYFWCSETKAVDDSTQKQEHCSQNLKQTMSNPD